MNEFELSCKDQAEISATLELLNEDYSDIATASRDESFFYDMQVLADDDVEKLESEFAAEPEC